MKITDLSRHLQYIYSLYCTIFQGNTGGDASGMAPIPLKMKILGWGMGDLSGVLKLQYLSSLAICNAGQDSWEL